MGNSYSRKNKCKDCKKLIVNKAKRCQSCCQKGKLHYLFNKHPSVLTRLKMSNSGKGRKFTETHRKNLSMACKNRKPIPLKLRQQISNTLRGRSLKEVNHKIKCKCSFCRASRKELIGKNNYNWRGGISNLPYGFEFNKKLKVFIKKRDKNKCQLCGCKQAKIKNKLSVHHIDYDKQNNNKNNLLTLCHCCNSKVNFNRDYWYAYFKYLTENKNV